MPLRRAMHRTLEGVQRRVPEWVRRAARPVYVRLYRLVFPRGGLEFSRPVARQVTPRPAAAPFAVPDGPKVSVVLPVWNDAGMAGDLIASVLRLSYRNLELLVVDDGSTEDLLPVMRRFAGDPRLRCIRRPHQGMEAAMRAGWRYASGETLPGPRAELPACLVELASFDAGGMERVAANLAYALRDAGMQVEVAVTGRGGKMADECRTAGIPVHLIGGDAAKFARLLEKARVVIPHYSTFGAPLAWRAGVPVVSFVHNSYIWTDAAEDRAIRDADLFITRYIAVSRPVREYLCRKYGVDPRKVVCVPNGVDVARLEAMATRPPRVTRASLGLCQDDYVFVNIAALTGTKAQVHAVCAVGALAERCPRLRLVLLKSQVDTVYFHEVKALVKELGLAGRVVFGPASDQVSDYYRLADAFLLPSLMEGWSLAMTEAMFFGLPLILTKVGGAAEAIDDMGILAPAAYADPLEVDAANLAAMAVDRAPSNLEALAAAMEEFYQRPQEWKARGRAGTAKVRARYDLRKVAAEQVGLIRTVAAQHYGA